MRISDYLNAHAEEIWAAQTISSMKTTTLNLLGSEQLKDNPDIDSAKRAIVRCKSDRAFLSTLGTLMTGIKCSDSKSMREYREELNRE